MAATKSSPKTEKSTEKKAKSQPDHPKYMDMIREAIIELKDRTGSSRQAIKKYILSKYTLTESVAIKQINLALKRGLDQKILYCPQGHSNSYKLFKQEKPKPKKPVAKKVAEKKKTTTKKAKPAAKKATTKKTTTKKAASTKKAATTKKSTTKAATTKKAASTKKVIKKKSASSTTKKAKSKSK